MATLQRYIQNRLTLCHQDLSRIEEIYKSIEKSIEHAELSAIRMEFDAIHKTIAKIEATEKVPLPNYPNADPIDPAFLLQLERDSFPTSIDGKIVDINVRELLNGIRPSKNQAVKVFISYSHQDKSFAKKLAGELERQGMKVKVKA
ncbi:MAG: toll/interleukin-1 receptor domain-containing protein [Anaerolineales bacterium]|nr:MAG: toll/interleukin-1 receptor domain-containing protein [Anaerolineales bacterium]